MTAYGNFIFYAYLRWLKDNKETVICRVLKLPITSKILLMALLVTSCMCIVFLLLGYTITTYISIVTLLICCVFSSIYLERYLVKSCMENFDDYKKYCYKLHDWLKKYNIDQKKELIIIRDRTLNQINSLKEFINKREENMVSILKVIVILVVLAAVTKLIENQTALDKVAMYIIQFIIVCVAFGGIVYAFWLVINISLKNKIDKYQCFANDLQGIIDIEFGLE